MNDDSFFSINRLMEFGMSMAVAQQMVNSMNEGMTKMQFPGTSPPGFQSQVSGHYHVMVDGTQAGPFSENEILTMLQVRKIHKETYVWCPGMTNWKMAEQVPEFLRLVALTPPPPPKEAFS